METASNFWNKNAEKYANSKISDLAAYEYTLGRSRSYLKATDEVLELGCGTGMTALKFAPFVLRITGTDISSEMIVRCRQRARDAAVDNVEFVEAEVTDPVLRERQYDVVMAHSLLHLLPDLQAGLSAIHQMVKPGGLFISKSVCIGEGGGLKTGLMKLAIPLLQLVGKAPYVNYLSVAALEQGVAAAGFQIVEPGNHPDGVPPARYLVARKT